MKKKSINNNKNQSDKKRNNNKNTPFKNINGIIPIDKFFNISIKKKEINKEEEEKKEKEKENNKEKIKKIPLVKFETIKNINDNSNNIKGKPKSYNNTIHLNKKIFNLTKEKSSDRKEFKGIKEQSNEVKEYSLIKDNNNIKKSKFTKDNNEQKKYNFFKDDNNNSKILNLISKETNTKILNFINEEENNKNEQKNLTDIQKYKNKASSTYFLSEYVIKKLLILIGGNISKLKNYFSQNKILEYSEMDKINIKEILIKFLLQFKINLIYIPKNLIIKNTQNYKDINLFTGFNDSKKLFLQYIPTEINQYELFDKNLINLIKNYINNFKGGKALYIQTKGDYRNYVKEIENICSILNYNILKIDETELTKYLRLNKLYEATQTKRILFIPDNINNQISLIKLMNKNFNIKWKEIIEENIESLVKFYQKNGNGKLDNNLTVSEKESDLDKSNLDNSNLDSSINSNSNDNIKINEILGKQLYQIINKNIIKFCNEQKSLILITDSFSTNDDRKYFLNILDTISTLKVPLIILSDNVNYVSTLGTNLINNLIFGFINNDNKSIGVYIFYISIILFFHIFCFEESNFKFSTYEDFVEKLTEKLCKFNFDENNKKQLIEISQFLVYKNNFDLEAIFFEIKRILRLFKVNKEKSKKLDFKLNKFLEILITENSNDNLKTKNNNLDDLIELYEKISFYDYIENKKDLMTFNEFENNKYYEIERSKFFDDFEEVNLENKKFNQIIFNNENDSFNDNIYQDCIFKYLKLQNEKDKKFLNIYFSNLITNKNINYYLSYIMNKNDSKYTEIKNSHNLNNLWFINNKYLNNFPNLTKEKKSKIK